MTYLREALTLLAQAAGIVILLFAAGAAAGTFWVGLCFVAGSTAGVCR